MDEIRFMMTRYCVVHINIDWDAELEVGGMARGMESGSRLAFGRDGR